MLKANYHMNEVDSDTEVEPEELTSKEKLTMQIEE